MKWIKTFEELTPRIYRDAGNRLMNIPHKKTKGRILKDYGSEKEWGVYNIELVKDYEDISRKVKFTKPTAKFVLNKKMQDGVNNINTRYEDISIEDMLDLWGTADRDLYFTIQFYFEPLEESKDTYLPTWGGLPLFSFRVDLSHWNDGLENWNNPEDYDEDYDDPPKQYTLQELYDECSELSIDLELPQNNPRVVYLGQGVNRAVYHYGIFSDRNSAFKFKKLLPTLINTEIEGKIWEVFSLLGDSKNFQRCIQALKYGVRINHLYDDVKALSSRSDAREPSRIWFRSGIADIPREVSKKEDIKEEPKEVQEPKEVKSNKEETPKSMWYQSRT